jgi:hypothetical protein
MMSFSWASDNVYSEMITVESEYRQQGSGKVHHGLQGPETRATTVAGGGIAEDKETAHAGRTSGEESGGA